MVYRSTTSTTIPWRLPSTGSAEAIRAGCRTDTAGSGWAKSEAKGEAPGRLRVRTSEKAGNGAVYLGNLRKITIFHRKITIFMGKITIFHGEITIFHGQIIMLHRQIIILHRQIHTFSWENHHF